MIRITKEEKKKLADLFPHYKFPRTMKQDSKRHHYFCVEAEELMRAIADSNAQAAELVMEFDRRRSLRRNYNRVMNGGRG